MSETYALRLQALQLVDEIQDFEDARTDDARRQAKIAVQGTFAFVRQRWQAISAEGGSAV